MLVLSCIHSSTCTRRFSLRLRLSLVPCGAICSMEVHAKIAQQKLISFLSYLCMFSSKSPVLLMKGDSFTRNRCPGNISGGGYFGAGRHPPFLYLKTSDWVFARFFPTDFHPQSHQIFAPLANVKTWGLDKRCGTVRISSWPRLNDIQNTRHSHSTIENHLVTGTHSSRIFIKTMMINGRPPWPSCGISCSRWSQLLSASYDSRLSSEDTEEFCI